MKSIKKIERQVNGKGEKKVKEKWNVDGSQIMKTKNKTDEAHRVRLS